MQPTIFRSLLNSRLLLLVLMGLIGAWTPSRRKPDPSADLIKVGIEGGVGVPYAWLGSKKMALNLSANPFEGDTEVSVSSNGNGSLGVVVGYGFSLLRKQEGTLHLGPEIGLKYGFTRRLELKHAAYTLRVEETVVQIPVGLKIRAFDGNKTHIKTGLVLGLQYDIAASSKLKQSGTPFNLHPSFCGDQDLKDIVEDFSSVSSVFFCDNMIELPRGIYMTMRISFPLELFQLDMDAVKSSVGPHKDRLQLIRCAHVSYMDLQAGIDLMRMFEEA